MKDEIKEIELDHFNNIDELKQNVETWIKEDDIYWNRWFSLYDLKLLLDCITNLREENRQTKLLKERYQLEKEDYKSRNEKAIEYIRNHQLVFELSSKKQIQYWFDMFYEDLINILQEDNTQENLYKYTPEKGFKLVGDEDVKD